MSLRQSTTPSERLLRGSIAVGAGVALKYVGIIHVSQTEVNQLHIMAIVGDENVGRLQVAVHHLLAHIVAHCRNHLVGNLDALFQRRVGVEKLA